MQFLQFLKVLALTLYGIICASEALPPHSHCIWNAHGALKYRSSVQCPLAIDDTTSPITSSWTPWSHFPKCMNSTAAAASAKHCLYTYSFFRGSLPLNLITTPEVAADTVSKVTESGVLWEAKGKSPGEATTQDRADTYEVVDIPGKEKGVVARRLIRRGEVLMIDSPALVVALDYLQAFPSEQRRILLERAIHLLPDRSLVMNLAASTGGHPVEDILRTNSFDISISDTSHIGLFPELSRINHSCRPNAFTRFSSSTLTFEIIAFRDINPGEEIAISYTPLGLPYSDRRQRLKKWGFPCTCELCSSSLSTRKQSDSRRTRIFQIWDEIEMHMQNDRDQVVELTKELLDLIEKERLTARIGDFYGELANIYYFMDDIDGARRFGKLALDYWILFDNVDQKHVHNIKAFLEQLE